MPDTFIIELTALRFHAGHGLFEEEQQAGNEFEASLWLECDAPPQTVRSISETINYAEVYNIVKQQFGKRTPLLETLAMRIADDLQERFTQLNKITISIRKLHPPITAFTGSVAVTYTRSVK
jgi:dihydroneopterin aldolase